MKNNWYYLPFVEEKINDISIENVKNTNIFQLKDNNLKSNPEDEFLYKELAKVWMTNDDFGVGELLSHIVHANGRCLCTGLGLGILPQILAAKTIVTEVVVIENQEEMIQLYQKQGFKDQPKIKIVHQDCKEYKDLQGFDFLSLEHSNNIDELLNDIDLIRKNTNSEKSICLTYLWETYIEKNIELAIKMNISTEIQNLQEFYFQSLYTTEYNTIKIPSIQFVQRVHNPNYFYTTRNDILKDIAKVLYDIDRVRDPVVRNTLPPMANLWG